MATQHETAVSAIAFREKLYALSIAGDFSDAERDGFSRLHAFFADRLASFQAMPRFGDASAFYDNAKHWSDEGVGHADQCKASDVTSQQPTYDAANNGGDALEAVTGPVQTTNILDSMASAAKGLRGSLLVGGGS